MGRLTAALLLAAILSACGQGPTDPTSWLSDEYFDSLPEDVRVAYVEHVRFAVFQEYAQPTFVDDASDAELLELASIWCADNPSRFSDVIGDELERRDVDVDPGRRFLPQPPIDEIMTRVADRHQQQLCAALG